jgi:S-formylglutathione hydrolase
VDQGDGRLVPGRRSCSPSGSQAACDRAGYPLTLRMQPGYDHSYYFIATFIGEHLAHHQKALGAA